jgi:hypothetical protein
VFCYTSWCFYVFSGTNLLTRCHNASSLCFCCFCVLEKLHRKYSRNWTKQKPKFLFSWHEMESKAEMGGARGQPHHRAARPAPGPRHQVVGPPGPPPDAALLPIYSPWRENPKHPINFPWNILQAATIIDARSGARSSSRHPAREGNHHWMPSSSPCLPPEWYVNILPWTTGP